MLTRYLGGIITRDLKALQREVAAYPDDASLWRVEPGITNPGGTLTLHLAGNFQYFIGALLGGTGYVRDRNAEFSRRGVSRDELKQEIEAALKAVEGGLASITDADLERPYPQPVGGVSLATGDFLIHLAVHLGYHLGQVDYHRRLVTGADRTVGALAPKELASAAPVG